MTSKLKIADLPSFGTMAVVELPHGQGKLSTEDKTLLKAKGFNQVLFATGAGNLVLRKV